MAPIYISISFIPLPVWVSGFGYKQLCVYTSVVFSPLRHLKPDLQLVPSLIPPYLPLYSPLSHSNYLSSCSLRPCNTIPTFLHTYLPITLPSTCLPSLASTPYYIYQKTPYPSGIRIPIYNSSTDHWLTHPPPPTYPHTHLSITNPSAPRHTTHPRSTPTYLTTRPSIHPPLNHRAIHNLRTRWTIHSTPLSQEREREKFRNTYGSF